ncbi:DUF2092 domain-containing protein [Streptomyces sp. B1866]|uniref:LolA family protein n=1 Tax=Streptomyces sp. B1866 TaxID=3075431 RepID=UPI00288EF923|nr:DUF2092 domain-containing protein [Streptomyces sp. B1866]MDT3398681.1 DUF2092 domain-containing protein [Streptomyces sp. B1866]
MAGTRPIQPADGGDWDESRPERRRKAVRYAVPLAVAGVAAATIGLVPALADSSSDDDPDLPAVSAEELIAKVAGSDAEELSGTVRITTDLGLPALPIGGSFTGGARDGGDASAAAPESKLAELAAGTHTLRVAADGAARQRVSIIEDAAEYSLIHNGDDVWAYDSATNSVYHATADDKAGGRGHRGGPKDFQGLGDATPRELARKVLAAVNGSTAVKVDGSTKVAGRDAYQLLIQPRQAGSTVGSVRIAVDADTGVPLKFTLQPRGGGKAAVDAAFTSVDFKAPKAGVFSFTPPKGAEVTEADRAKARAGGGRAADLLSGLNVVGDGWASVAELHISDTPLSGKDALAARQFLDGLGRKVKGEFGTGTVLSTRLINVLLTDDGRILVGAVDRNTLVKAADAAE